MTNSQIDLTDEQWFRIADVFPYPPPTHAGGTPPVRPVRVWNGILWILRTGPRWQDLPETIPSVITCWRRLRDWSRASVMLRTWSRCLHHLDRVHKFDFEQSLANGMFCRAKGE